jgi:hypothetical protein
MKQPASDAIDDGRFTASTWFDVPSVKLQSPLQDKPAARLATLELFYVIASL